MGKEQLSTNGARQTHAIQDVLVVTRVQMKLMKAIDNL
jgi:hypothetical protein